MSARVRQIVIYRVQTHQVDELEALKDQMISESLTLDGLESSTTVRVLGEDGVFADTMVWTSKEAADKAMPAFEKLPTAPRFLGMMDGPPLHQLFFEYQPDQSVTASA